MSAKARCEKCKTTIQSKSRHDFVPCVCGAIFVDGGDDYFRCGYDKPENITFIYEDGREENGAESVRKYREEHPPTVVTAPVSVPPSFSAADQNNVLLLQVLEELREVKRLTLAIGTYLSK